MDIKSVILGFIVNIIPIISAVYVIVGIRLLAQKKQK